MRVPYKSVNPNHYIKYYALQQQQQQSGGNPYFQGSVYQRGNGGLPYFRGSIYQHGDGLGSIFSSIARFVSGMPSWIKTGAKVLGKQAVKTGLDVARDMAADSEPWKEDWRSQSKKYLKRAAGEMLEEGGKRLQQGKGINRRQKKRKTTSIGKTTRKKRGRSIKTISPKRTKRDIFNISSSNNNSLFGRVP